MLKRGCHHSSVVSSVPSILLPWVRVPITPSMLSHLYCAIFVFAMWKRTKINKKKLGLAHFLTKYNFVKIVLRKIGVASTKDRKRMFKNRQIGIWQLVASKWLAQWSTWVLCRNILVKLTSHLSSDFFAWTTILRPLLEVVWWFKQRRYTFL